MTRHARTSLSTQTRSTTPHLLITAEQKDAHVRHPVARTTGVESWWPRYTSGCWLACHARTQRFMQSASAVAEAHFPKNMELIFRPGLLPRSVDEPPLPPPRRRLVERADWSPKRADWSPKLPCERRRPNESDLERRESSPRDDFCPPRSLARPLKLPSWLSSSREAASGRSGGGRFPPPRLVLLPRDDWLPLWWSFDSSRDVVL